MLFRSLLDRTLALLNSAGLPAAAAWVDHEVLGVGRDTPSCFAEGERRLLCAPGVAGFAGPGGVVRRWAAAQGVTLDRPAEDVSGRAFFHALRWPGAGVSSLDLLTGRFEPPARRAPDAPSENSRISPSSASPPAR